MTYKYTNFMASSNIITLYNKNFHAIFTVFMSVHVLP